MKNHKLILVVFGVTVLLQISCSKSQVQPPATGLVEKTQGPPSKLEEFVDPLPIPARIDLNQVDTYSMVASQFAHQFHRDLHPSQVWGYNKTYPNPNLEAETGHVTKVLWVNHLPNQALFPVTGLMPEVQGLPAGRTVVHLHGGSFPEVGYDDRRTNADGWPDAWNVPGETQLAIYPNTQEATGLWYHDHTTGITSQNVYAGLAGMYLLRDSYEKSLKLPTGGFEIPLLIQSRSFNPDGSSFYPTQVVTEFYGTTTTVNGKVWPYLTVEPRIYRLRFLNASNARTYAMKFAPQSDVNAAGPDLIQIGSDGGFLEEVARPDRLTMAPGERADVLVDFSRFAGQSLVLGNDSQTDDERLEPPIPDVMLFKVARKTSVQDLTIIPNRLRKIVRIEEKSALRSRDIVLSEIDNPDGTQMLLLNGLHWSDPIVEKPLLNSVEIWRLINTTEDIHPFHIHLVQFQVLDRHPFDVETYKAKGKIIFTGDPTPPDANEAGWKDTVRASAGQVTRIIMRFGPYLGRYVYHCHILEHEDMDMMRPFEVVADPSQTDPIEGTSALRKTLGRLKSLVSRIYPSRRPYDRSPAQERRP